MTERTTRPVFGTFRARGRGVAPWPALGLLPLLGLLPDLSAAEPPVAKAPVPPAPVVSETEGLRFFEQKIRPVLVAKCYECHSAESKQLKGGLALDTRAGIIQGGDSGPAVIPGNPDESPLVQAIRYDGVEMPPTERLSAETVADFGKWVRMGAPDPREGNTAPVRKTIDIAAGRKHWSFRPPQRHPAPAVKQADQAPTPIDAFLQAKIEAAKIVPNPIAERRTLLRRVTFDLIGLPPTPEEIAAFEQDASPDAWDKVVDRLLASPRFGERWGRHWLDLARYSDSNGKDENLTFHQAWRYRDYVVSAFNHDKPFDRFVKEQVAGDLLPTEDPAVRDEGLVALGLLVMGPKVLAERDKVQLKMDVIDEQIDTLGRAFLGLTLGCARCHDHKFDPVPTRDYYALAGIFSSVVTIEGFKAGNPVISGWPERPLGPDGQRLADEYAAHTKQLKTVANELKKARDELKKFDDKAMMKQPALLSGIIVDDADAKLVGFWKPSTFNPKYVGKGYLHDDKLDKGKKSATFTADLPATGEYDVLLAYTGGKGRDPAVPVTIGHAGGTAKLTLDQQGTPEVDGLFRSLGKFKFEKGKPATVVIETTDTKEYVIVDAVQFLPVRGTEVAALPTDPNAPAGVPADVLAALEKSAAKVKELEAKEAELKARKLPLPPLAMAVRDAPDPADARIHVRGSIHSLGETVPRGLLQVISYKPQPVIPANQSGRLQLAEWLADRDNPLTARVYVNRVWMHLFGEGLVRTVDNFGLTGEAPSHPELLDTLAVEFMDDGWSTKRLIGRIVRTAAYRRSSKRNASAECDPENRLLSHTVRRRVEAEVLRDAVLALSGKLDLTAGGTAIEKLGERAIDNSSKGGLDVDEHVRRSLYLPVIRNEVSTFMAVFDFADPDFGNGRRDRTTVAPQALYLLNSPFVRNMALAGARKLLAEPGDDAARVRSAYERAFGRAPSESELHAALAFLRSFEEELGRLPAPDKGKAKGKTDDTAATPRERAWAAFTQAVYGSTEFRFVD